MPRSVTSVKDSDDDLEPKGVIGRMQTRMLTVNSPLRRSSRISIKQSKYSPGSESDSSISSNQTIRSTRAQTASGDSTVPDTMKKLRKNSASSEVSEIDVEGLETPVKRRTRQNSSSNTPTKVITRASSKRFTRAGSEINLESARITRSTRANSVGPESLPNQNKKFDTPTKTTRRRASMLPLSFQNKEQIELKDRVPYVKLDATIAETDEITSSGNSESSPDKASRFAQSKKINQNCQSIDKDESEKNSNFEKVETSPDSKSEAHQLSEEKGKAQAEDMDKVTVKDTETTDAEEQWRFVKTSSFSDIDIIIDSSSPPSQNFVKDKKTEAESLSDLESSLVEMCQSKELESMPENLLDTSGEEQRSNKENQILNIINDAEKGMPQVILSSVKSLALPFTANKSLNEKEIKSMKKELNSSNRRRSRESTEIAIKHSDLSQESADGSPEKMDISVESLNLTAINKSNLSQHHNTELVDMVTNTDKTSVENISTFNSNEETTEICEKISESDKIDKIECTIANNKDCNRMKSNEEDETSRSSPCLIQSKQIRDDRDNLTSSLDDDEMKLMLDERSPSRDKSEVSVHANNKSNQLIDLHIMTPNTSSDDEAIIMEEQLVQDKVIDNSVSIEQKQEQTTSSKHVTELVSKSSNAVLETNNSTCGISNDATIQDNQSFGEIDTSKISTMDISTEKTDTEDSLLKKIVKQNLKRKSTDNLEGEKESSQMETNQKDREDMEIDDDASDVNIGINLFQDIPVDKWKEKNNAEPNAVQVTSQSAGEVENGSESSDDLLLANKQAWLKAETIKAAKVSESFEYDSDDTIDMLWKSQSDASRTNHSMEKSDSVKECLMDDIENKENRKQVKRQQSRTIKRLTTEIDQDSPPRAEDESDEVNADKSLNKSKTALNQTNDRPISRLDTSGSAKTKEQSFKADKDLEEEIEGDTSELNRRSLSKKNTSLRKSIKERTSLNKSLKDTSVHNVSVNKARVDDSEEELDNTNTCTGKKLDKKRSLNKSSNKETDDNATKSKKNNISTKDSNKKNENTPLNRSVEKSKSVIEKLTDLTDDESSNSDINLVPIEFKARTYSTVANKGSDSDHESTKNYYQSEIIQSDDDFDDSSSDSDINREYNLDGVEQKFSDDDVIADECRTSEVEFSDSDDNGSDLADFIVDDDEVEDEEENNEEEDDNEQNDNNEEDDSNKEDDDNEEDDSNEDDNDEDIQNLQDAQKKKVTVNHHIFDNSKQAREYELENMEIANEEDNENVQKDEDTTDEEEDENQFTKMEANSSCVSASDKLSNIHKSKNKSSMRASPRTTKTETKHDVFNKMKNSSNSNLSTEKKKKKSLTKENETILSETTNLISSSTKKRRKTDPQYFSKSRDEQNLTGQLNELESEFESGGNLSKSLMSMKFSTPKLNAYKKVGLDEKLERTLGSKNNSLTSEVTQITMKEKSKEDPILNKNNSLKLFSDAHKDMVITMSQDNFSLDLLGSEQTNYFKQLCKSTPPKTESRKSMNIQIETPTIKHLRKEKLNESAPMLTEAGSLQKKLLIKNKDARQTKMQEKNNEEVAEVITLSNDDVVQKRSKKKQKKRKEQESSKENIIDKVLPDGITKLDVAEKKKPVKFAQLTSVEEDTCEDVCQINEKKKKRKKLHTTQENYSITVLSEDVIETNVPKKKKLAKLTQSTSVETDTREDVCQINEKKKKKKRQDTSKEHVIVKASPENVIEVNIPKKKKLVKLTQLTSVEDDIREDVCQINKKKKKKKQDTSKEHIIVKALSEDVMEANIPKKKKLVKLNQLTSVEDDIHDDVCQISEKKKKKKKQNTSKEHVIVKASPENVIEINVPKKKKRVKFTQLTSVEDNTRKDVCQMNEKRKKKKKQDTSEKNITDEALSEELNISKKKKDVQFIQSLNAKDDRTREATYQINEKQKKKKKQETSKENITEENVFEDAVKLKIPKKQKLAKHSQLAIVQDNIREDAYQFNEKQKKKKKQVSKEDIVEKTLSEDSGKLQISKKKKNANTNKLTIVQNNASEYACQINKVEKKNKEKQIHVIEQDINEADLFKYICQNATEFLLHKKKNKFVNKQEKLVKKKAKQQKAIESIETKRTEKKHTLPIQIPVSKLKSGKISLSDKLQETSLDMSESKNVAHNTKELKSKKRRRPDIENESHTNILAKKSKKEVKEESKILSSSSGLKRLSDEVIKNLVDVPTRAKKRQKILRDEEKIVPSKKIGKSKTATATRDDSLTSQTSDCTTQFRAVNVQDTKKPSKPADAVASFRQRMFDRNAREPISAYLIYHDKIKSTK